LFRDEPKLRQLHPGRWKCCQGVDCDTAAKLIKYFVLKFIANPKDKKSGEIACVLWLLVGIAQRDGTDRKTLRVTIQSVLKASSRDIDPDDAVVTIGGCRVDVSWGLRNLLLCLRGRGKGQRACRLFANLDRSGKALGRALIEASKEVLPEGRDLVLPEAFLISPHLYKGVRMSATQRRAMKSAKRNSPSVTRNVIKKALRNA